jgi:hypothetical protein
MPFVPHRLLGFGTGGTQECEAVSGTVDLVTTPTPRSGVYRLRLQATGQVRSNHTQGIRQLVAILRFNSITPAVANKFLSVTETVGLAFELEQQTNGDVKVLNRLGATAATISSPFSVDTDHILRYSVDTFGEKLRIWIDGVLKFTSDAIDIHDTSTAAGYTQFNNASGTGIIMYVDCALVGGASSVDDAFPADCRVETFRVKGTGASGNPTERGADNFVTDGGNWAHLSEIPFSDTNKYTLTAAKTYIADCDSADGAGRGPSGSGKIGATDVLICGKWMGRFSRGNGATTTFTIHYGSSGDAPTTVELLSLTTTPAFFSGGASAEQQPFTGALVPQYDEFATLGFQRSAGGRDFVVADFCMSIAFEPAPPSPPQAGKRRAGGLVGPP